MPMFKSEKAKSFCLFLDQFVIVGGAGALVGILLRGDYSWWQPLLAAGLFVWGSVNYFRDRRYPAYQKAS